MVTYQAQSNYKEFCTRHPQFIKKLHYWAGKRRGWRLYGHLEGRARDEAVSSHVEEYLTELVFDIKFSKKLEEHLRENIAHSENYLVNTAAIGKWERILSRQEKTVVAELSPIRWPADSRSSWYSLTQSGEYIVWDEPVLDGFMFEGRQVAEVTENAYECEVLNASNLCIIDVDLDPSGGSFESVVALSQHQALAALDAIAHQFPQYGFRVYRTAGGLRYLCTTQEMHPTDPRVLKLMENLYVDPLYKKLCLFQETFRARLTPKPWRADSGRMAYNRDTGKVEPGDHGVCQLIKIVGEDIILPQFEAIVRLHDERTKALEFDLDLA